MLKQIILISSVLGASVLTGCTTAPEKFFPTDGQTMQQIYNEQSAGGSDGTAGRIWGNGQHYVNKRVATPTERNINPYINHNTPKPEFKMLQNPTMYLFVNTHLSTKDNIVVPAYITEFKLLERDEYALPGEINTSNWQ
ncbi:TPA: TIGR03751 family conjugal transfer lipoprotein [Photobacterium damselae]